MKPRRCSTPCSSIYHGSTLTFPRPGKFRVILDQPTHSPGSSCVAKPWPRPRSSSSPPSGCRTCSVTLEAVPCTLGVDSQQRSTPAVTMGFTGVEDLREKKQRENKLQLVLLAICFILCVWCVVFRGNIGENQRRQRVQQLG